MAKLPVLVISGPPGVGKSTAARLVAEDQEPSVCIESDWIWSTIKRGFIQPWLPESAAQNRTAVSAYCAAAARMAAGGFFVVLEGVIGPWFLDVLTREFREYEAGFVYLILRVPRDVAIARAGSRVGEEVLQGWLPVLSDPGPVGYLWDHFFNLGEYEGNVVDITGLEPSGVAAAIRERYRAASTF